MHGVALLIAATTLGVDYGWQPVEGESLEYIIQIEPELVTALEAGEAITSEIPADVQGVRRFRIQIGEAALPQVEHDPFGGGAGGVPTPAQPPADTSPTEFQHGDHTHSTPEAADHPPVIQPPPGSGASSQYGEGDSQYGETGSVYGESSETPAPARGGEFQAPLSVDPPPAVESGGDLFTGSGGMFGGGRERVADTGSSPTAPPATLPLENDGPSLELPLLEPPAGAGSQGEVTLPSRQPATLPPPGPSPFRQPDLLSPAEAASELTGFESEETATHEDHDPHEHEAEVVAKPTANPESKSQEEAPAATSRPWLPLTLTALLLFASLGANAYLGWILLETLARYRRLQSEQAG